MEKKTKAIGLLSGGLDSVLAAKLLLEQGIEVEALNFMTVFCTCTSKDSTCLASSRAAEKLKIPLEVIDVSREMLEVVKHPKHGYGSGVNPCIDCRIFILKKAKEYMGSSGASFVFTGEVIGQRPMSQKRKVMNIIETESGLNGYLLRPLCAKLFPPTFAEKQGLVDREKLLCINGRSRKQQIRLADSFDIKDYPCPAGGCLLTDKGFASRVKDLMKHKPDFDLKDIMLLKYGRHFRISYGTKLVVGRNEDENHKITSLKRPEDTMFHAQDPLGPVSLLCGDPQEEEVRKSASIIARYALGKDKQGEAKIRRFGDPASEEVIKSGPCEEDLLSRLRI